ncbi:Protein PRRC1 [Gryllus bimaculatus]|nr:Protein PRRC1 [Gryllus bimaculatus]
MMQEDSNGESTFEFVDKKSDDMSNSLETMPKTDSLSSLSSSSVSLVPSATGLVPTGSLLTNVPPPSALPSFVTSESSPQHFASASSVTSQISSASYQPPAPSSLSQPISAPPLAFHQTQFCPVIPASKGGPPPSLAGAGGSPATPEVAVEAGEQAGGDGSAGLFGWVRGVAGGVTSSNLLSRMAEKARNSVDSMITTLDPQMREFLHSGGDVDIVVASDKEVKVSPVREAFQAVFGKATVTGLAAQPTNIAAQPVGFEAATTAARERIIAVRATHGLPAQQPVLAVENFLLEISPDNDPGQALELSTFTQGTPVPAPIVALAHEATPADYPLKASGLATTVGSLMGQNLQVPPSQWHEALTGVPRREMVLIAARALAGMYKSSNRSLL